MKKIYSFMVAAVAVFGAVACTQELDNNVPEANGETVVFTAYADGADETKTVLNTTGEKPVSEWDGDDAITIYNGTKGFTFTTTDKGAKAVFSYTGEDFGGEKFIAVYPAREYNADVEAKTVTAHIPTWQEANDETYYETAALAVAYSENQSLKFKNATALLKFTVKNDNVKSVTFYGHDAEDAISGNVLVSLNEDSTIKSVNGQPTSNFAFEPEDNKVYLIPSSEWKTDNAPFAAYFFGNGDKWLSVSDDDNNGVYEVEIPEGFTSVIFCRMKPGTTENSWGNKDKQTADLSLAEGQVYTVDGWDGGKWEANTPSLRTYVELYAKDGYLTPGSVYYLAVAPRNFTAGFAVELEIDGVKRQVATREEAYEIKPNMILNIGELEYVVAEPEEPENSNVLYMKPHEEWHKYGSWYFAAYFFGAGDKWVKLEDVDSDGVYECNIPEGGYTSVIFTQMFDDKELSEGWNAKKNQTVDLTIPTDGKNLFTMDNPWNESFEWKATGTWSTK